VNDRLEFEMKLQRGLNLGIHAFYRQLKIRTLNANSELRFDQPFLLLTHDSVDELRQLFPIVCKFNELRTLVYPLQTWKLSRSVLMTEELSFEFAETDIAVYVRFAERKVNIRDGSRFGTHLRLEQHQWEQVLARNGAHGLTDIMRAKRMRLQQGEASNGASLEKMHIIRFRDRYGNALRTGLAIRPCPDDTLKEDGPSRRQIEEETDKSLIYLCQTHAWTGLVRLLDFLLAFVAYDEKHNPNDIKNYSWRMHNLANRYD